MEPVIRLLSGLIDYAGLFPPAGLGMREAVRSYAQYSAGDESWALGAFVVPVARLGEFAREFEALPPRGSASSTWRLSALGGSDTDADISAIRAFNEDAKVRTVFCRVHSLETKVGSVSQLQRVRGAVEAGLAAYVEVLPDGSVDDIVAEIARLGARAKVRTGGVTEAEFPASGALVRFLRSCHDRQVAFKATAGLHHPLRSIQRLTHRSDSPAVMMHGFLNLFLAALFAVEGAGDDELEKLVDEESSNAFHFDADGVRWRGRRSSAATIDKVRRQFALSFGSCSFEEPLHELRVLGLLGPGLATEDAPATAP